MTRVFASSLAAVAVAVLFTACGGSGGSSSTLAVEDVEPRLNDAGITCTQSAIEPFQDGLVARAATCLIGDQGGVVVAVADTTDDFADVKTSLCGEADSQEDLPNIAYGDNWLAVIALQDESVTAEQVAEALGGESGSVTAFCA